jgi:hypothetical protein
MVTMPGGLVVEDGRTEIEHRRRQRLPFGRVRNETRYVGGHLFTPEIKRKNFFWSYLKTIKKHIFSHHN